MWETPKGGKTHTSISSKRRARRKRRALLLKSGADSTNSNVSNQTTLTEGSTAQSDDIFPNDDTPQEPYSSTTDSHDCTPSQVPVDEINFPPRKYNDIRAILTAASALGDISGISGSSPDSVPTPTQSNNQCETGDHANNTVKETTGNLPVNKTSVAISEFEVRIREKRYSETAENGFVILLDAFNDQETSEHTLGNILMTLDVSENTRFDRIGVNRYIVWVQCREDFEMIMHTKLIKDKFAPSLSSQQTEYIGVIRTDPKHDILTDILQEQPSGVNSAQYMCRYTDGRRIKMNLLKVHFHGTDPVHTLRVGHRQFHVEKYMHKIKLCSACYRFGHLRHSCNSRPRCRRCGKRSCRNQCPYDERTITCLGCRQPGHLIGNRNCNLLQFLIGRNEDLHQRKITFRQAIREFLEDSGVRVNRTSGQHRPCPILMEEHGGDRRQTWPLLPTPPPKCVQPGCQRVNFAQQQSYEEQRNYAQPSIPTHQEHQQHDSSDQQSTGPLQGLQHNNQENEQPAQLQTYSETVQTSNQQGALQSEYSSRLPSKTFQHEQYSIQGNSRPALLTTQLGFNNLTEETSINRLRHQSRPQLSEQTNTRPALLPTPAMFRPIHNPQFQYSPQNDFIPYITQYINNAIMSTLQQLFPSIYNRHG